MLSHHRVFESLCHSKKNFFLLSHLRRSDLDHIGFVREATDFNKRVLGPFFIYRSVVKLCSFSRLKVDAFLLQHNVVLLAGMLFTHLNVEVLVEDFYVHAR